MLNLCKSVFWPILVKRAKSHATRYVTSHRSSCKEVTEMAVGMARTALDAISQGANVGRDVAIGAAETAQDAHSNGRAPAQQGMSW